MGLKFKEKLPLAMAFDNTNTDEVDQIGIQRIYDIIHDALEEDEGNGNINGVSSEETVTTTISDGAGNLNTEVQIIPTLTITGETRTLGKRYLIGLHIPYFNLSMASAHATAGNIVFTIVIKNALGTVTKETYYSLFSVNGNYEGDFENNCSLSVLTDSLLVNGDTIKVYAKVQTVNIDETLTFSIGVSQVSACSVTPVVPTV